MTKQEDKTGGSPREQIALPDCGMFIGTGVYPMAGDYMLSNLLAHPYWTPETNTPDMMIQRVVDDNQGNLVQVWGYSRGYAPAMRAEWFYALDEIGVEVPQPDWENGKYIQADDCKELEEHDDRYGAGLVRFIQRAAEQGLYTQCIYTDGRPEWVAKLHDFDGHYLGYDFGERFRPSVDEAALAEPGAEERILQLQADSLIRSVREHIEPRRAAGWGPIYATSSSFHVDYEVVAGTDVPLIEDFAFRHLGVASALSRGLYRQFELPLWGSHLAHEHYSWIPLAAEHKFDLLAAAMKQKYMAGCKMIINESGNWFVEASLCEDSPLFDLPQLPGDPEIGWKICNPEKLVPLQAEARQQFAKTGYDSPTCREYRRVTSEFYDFVKANPAPEGQPEPGIAIAKGHCDFAHHTYNSNGSVCRSRRGEINPLNFEGAPERGWQIVKDVFFPLHDILGPYPNHFLSGTPYGMVDIVTFAQDRIDADFLSKHYKALLFAGWNTASEKQYDVLTEYVRRGGTLFIATPQLATLANRNYLTYTAADLVHGGDFSELCGLRVKGPGSRLTWATAKPGVEDLGFRFPRRFGLLCTRMGDIEIVDPAAETLVVDDERGEPLLLRRRCGEGAVYYLNSWEYPAALNQDDGPGARTYTKGLIGEIYRHIAGNCRGSVWITDDGERVGMECEYVAWSHFPQAGRLFLQNVDFDHPHEICLHQGGELTRVCLAPGEFRTVEARVP